MVSPVPHQLFPPGLTFIHKLFQVQGAAARHQIAEQEI
jgi:hypothetical protein